MKNIAQILQGEILILVHKVNGLIYAISLHLKRPRGESSSDISQNNAPKEHGSGTLET